MLTEKDHCDLELTTILQEVGMSIKNVVATSPQGATKWYSNVTLYEAQKWLREEKNIIVEATFNLMYKGQPRFGWRVLYNLTQHKGAYYTFDSVKSKEDHDSFEEALSEGILDAVEILKENETIHE